METRLYLDTHVIVWLYSGQKHFLSSKSLELIESNHLFMSPIVGLELKYLCDIKKLNHAPKKIIHSLKKQFNLTVCSQDFYSVVQNAYQLTWTRDPFDRIITAHAAVENMPLLTRDESILKNYAHAVWD